MFKSLKLYIGLNTDIGRLLLNLVDFGYKRQEEVSTEGEFSSRGGIIDIFPVSFELPIRVELDNDTILSIKTFNPLTGEFIWQHRIVILLAHKSYARAKDSLISEEIPLSNFIDLDIGDYVVHNQHGIGKFLGIEKIKAQGSLQDHLVIEYDCKEKLYVPISSMNLIQKYFGLNTRRPKLNRLASKEWKRVKERARKKIQKLAWELLTLQAMRLSLKGFKYPKDTDWQKKFEDSFPFEETPDQAKASLEIKEEMEAGRLIDRLLCGDVGYGKTEVAMRSAFKTVMGGKQVAYLVPTTILASQHYENFSKRLKEFPFNIKLLCRFRNLKEQRESINGLKNGSVDIVIGTHRLLSDDVDFKDLGLLIIDEEQRFGVRAKEKLKKLKASTNVITLTATPIPRTLYMSLISAKELSVINTPPLNRLPIKTLVVEYDEDLICQAILREVRRKGQVFFLHNRIEDIEEVVERLKKILPEKVSIGIGHGRMPPKALEKVMSDFLKGKIDCLVSTMIIESGIDIPNANTIIINKAHTFGLSDMHQLRGRVGRFNRKAYAYLLIPKNFVLEKTAKRRLDAVSKYAQLGAGFRIAMEDLEIRGAGNLLGIQQHGFIYSIGFDLYCRLLREAIFTFKKAGLFNEYKN
ncbi:MAG: transcription-repair coupling factor [Candidatus Omnitrophota bacterium]